MSTSRPSAVVGGAFKERVCGRRPKRSIKVAVGLLEAMGIDLSFLLKNTAFFRPTDITTGHRGGRVAALNHAETLVVELLRFLLIKVSVGEVEEHGTHTSPSLIEDEAWHALILYTREYEKLCAALTGETGKLLHHDPRSAHDSTREARYANTLAAYRDLFGEEPPAHFWPRPEQQLVSGQRQAVTRGRAVPAVGEERTVGTGGAAGGRSSSSTAAAAAEVAAAQEGARPKRAREEVNENEPQNNHQHHRQLEQNEEIMIVHVRAPDGVTDFKVKKSTKMSKIIGAYCDRHDVIPEEIRLFVCGERASIRRTVGDMDLQDGDHIDLGFE